MQHRDRGLPPMSLGWKLWFAFVALFGLAFVAFVVWAVVTALNIWESK